MRHEHVSRKGWLYQPQRTALRKAIFQVHLWAGLVLAVYSIVIGLSGSALVFKQDLEEHFHPRLFHLAQRPATTTLEAAVRQMEADRPSWRATGLKDFSDPGNAVTLLMARRGAPPDSNYRAISFDRADGRVLRDRMRYDGVLGFLANLHFNLLSGHTGLLVSGGMAAGLLLLCITGLLLWWRGVQRWFEFLWLRLHRLRGHGVNWRRLNWDLHSVVGFWSSALLLVVTFTGLYFCFPEVVRPAVLFITASSSASQQSASKGPRPGTNPRRNMPGRMSLDDALARAAAVLPAHAPADYLFIPGKPGVPFSVTGYYVGAAPYAKLARVSFDASTGQVLTREDTTALSRGDRLIQSFFAIHFGSFAQGTRFDLMVKALWALLGLLPALLAVTGCILWWNRVLRPRRVRRQRLVPQTLH